MIFSRQELEEKLKKCIGKTLGEIDSANVFNKTKENNKITGIAGDVIEQSVLGLKANNKQEPDLCVDGKLVELKTTGVRLYKNNVYKAKEPLSITAVSPNKIVSENFEDSHFFNKVKNILIVYYVYQSNHIVSASEYRNFPVLGYQFLSFNSSDLKTLKGDWETVKNYIIKLNNSFEVPEKEYPKITSETRKKMFFLDIAPKYPHPMRFRFRRAFVNNILQKYLGQQLETIDYQFDSTANFDNILKTIVDSFKEKSVSEILNFFDIQKINKKSFAEQIIVKMFGTHSTKLSKVDFFNKTNISAKSIILNKNNKKTEDIKLFKIDFEEISNPDINFEESQFFDFFHNHFLFVLFKEDFSNCTIENIRFFDFVRFSFEDDFLYDVVKPVWDEIRNLIINNKLIDKVFYDKNGLPIINKNGTVRSAPNFPKSSNNKIFVRGDGNDSNDKPETVNGIKMYRQYIWIHGSVIVDLLSDFIAFDS